MYVYRGHSWQGDHWGLWPFADRTAEVFRRRERGLTLGSLPGDQQAVAGPEMVWRNLIGLPWLYNVFSFPGTLRLHSSNSGVCVVTPCLSAWTLPTPTSSPMVWTLGRRTNNLPFIRQHTVRHDASSKECQGSSGSLKRLVGEEMGSRDLYQRDDGVCHHLLKRSGRINRKL